MQKENRGLVYCIYHCHFYADDVYDDDDGDDDDGVDDDVDDDDCDQSCQMSGLG